MSSADFEHRLEAETVALNRWLYAESIGLEVDEQGYAAHADALSQMYRAWLERASEPASSYFALESWSEARRIELDQRVSAEMDRRLSLADFQSSEGILTWRNWKAFEREISDQRLNEAFEQMIEASAALVPMLEERLSQVRADFAAHGLTPVHTYCWREGLTLDGLRDLLLHVGQACRGPFRDLLNRLSQEVFGRDAGPAELRALYLNRMYEPGARFFAPRTGELSPDDSAAKLIRETQAAFHATGFDLAHVPVDVENRPRKYPGAFCFPVSIPDDVRVSVRVASPHHLADMLYHEFGHAAHFSGIRADLPFLDRYWLHSGTHETFSTLFESWLHEPAFLQTQFGFTAKTITRLMEFARFKTLLTGTWHSAAALAAMEAWTENLAWPEIEIRYAGHMHDFTGVRVPPGFARLAYFVASASIYPAGYVLAEMRVAHWRKRLRALGGDEWWRSPHAQADIWEMVRAGGTARFPSEWNDPATFTRG